MKLLRHQQRVNRDQLIDDHSSRVLTGSRKVKDDFSECQAVF
jgi:hypothetical protein